MTELNQELVRKVVGKYPKYLEIEHISYKKIPMGKEEVTREIF